MEENNDRKSIDAVTYMREIIKKNGKDCLEETISLTGRDVMVLFSCLQRVVIIEASLLDILSKTGVISEQNFKVVDEEISGLIQRLDEFAIDVLDKIEEKYNG